MLDSIEPFQIHKVAQGLKDFILNDFSRWYIKLIRDRTAPSYMGADKKAAQYTLNMVLETVTRAMAPISPFLTEYIYRCLFGESVHLEDYPKPDKRKIDKKLEEEMEVVKSIFEASSALRQEKEIKLRWPLDKIFVQIDKPPKLLIETAKHICNAKEIVFVKKLSGRKKEFKGGALAIGTALKDEALVRELIRKVQQLRKEAGLKVSDTILLFLKTDGESEKIIGKFRNDVLVGTGSKSLEFTLKKRKGSLDFEGSVIEIGFYKK